MHVHCLRYICGISFFYIISLSAGELGSLLSNVLEDPFGLSDVFDQRLGAQIETQKNRFTIQNTIDYLQAQDEKELLWTAFIAYGITEGLGIEFEFPFFIRNQDGENKSEGISDIFIILEWVFFRAKANRAIFMGGIKCPTGNVNKEPATGSGTFDFFLELSMIHSSKDWYFASNVNALLPIERKGRNPGRGYQFEFTFGRAITFLNGETSRFFINLDLFVLYAQRSGFVGILEELDGGSTFFLGPLLSWSKENLLFEFAIEWPIAQNRFGDQPPFDYFILLSSSITF